MSKLDDIEVAVDASAQAASEDIARMSELIMKAIVMIKDLQSGSDPVHADAIVAKINTLKDTLTGTVAHVLDTLDEVVNPHPTE